MDDIKLTNEKMLPSSDIDIEDYFDGCFGINHSDDQKPEIIRIKAINTQAEYINALPIHESHRGAQVPDPSAPSTTAPFITAGLFCYNERVPLIS